MADFKAVLSEELKKENIPFTEKQTEELSTVYEMLCEYNKKVNLTAVTDPELSAKKHFADSLLPLLTDIFTDKKTCLDVGTGAGFPGLPLAIFLPEVSFTLIDSLDKKLAFTRSVKEKLNLENTDILTVRAEEYARTEKREAFDIVVSRAVANLATLSELCLPFVKVGGVFAAYKSKEAKNEIKDAETAIKTLGGEVENIFGDEERNLVIIRKIAATPEKYPRRNGVPAKKPLK